MDIQDITPEMLQALIETGVLPQEQAMALSDLIRAQKVQDADLPLAHSVGSDMFGSIIDRPSLFRSFEGGYDKARAGGDEAQAKATMLANILRQKGYAKKVGGGLLEADQKRQANAPAFPPGQQVTEMPPMYIPGSQTAEMPPLYIPGPGEVDPLYIGTDPKDPRNVKKKRNFAALPWPQDQEG